MSRHLSVPSCTIGSEPGISQRYDRAARQIAKSIVGGDRAPLGTVDVTAITPPLRFAPDLDPTQEGFRFYALGALHNRTLGHLLKLGVNDGEVLPLLISAFSEEAWGRLALIAAIEKYEESPREFCTLLRSFAEWTDFNDVQFLSGKRHLGYLDLVAVRLSDFLLSWGHSHRTPSRVELERLADRVETAGANDIIRALQIYASAGRDQLRELHGYVPDDSQIEAYVRSLSSIELRQIQACGTSAVGRVFDALEAE